MGKQGLPILVFALACTGCATMFARDTRQVFVDSVPRGAQVYAGSSELEGPTPRWVTLDQNDDARIRVVLGDLAYVCDYSSELGLKWVLLDIPLVVPLVVDLFLGEGGELERADSDRYGPLADERRIGVWRARAWGQDPGAASDRCFADFRPVGAAATAPPPATVVEVPAVDAAARKVQGIAAALDTRARRDIIATVRNGPWLAILVHGGLGSPTGLAGGGLELGYSPWLSLEVGIGADLDAFIDDGGPETSALLRGRVFSAGERWFGLGTGLVQSRGPSGPPTRSVEDPLWIAAEAFGEQPFTRFGLFRLSGGGKRVIDKESCVGEACDGARTELYLDLALGFQF